MMIITQCSTCNEQMKGTAEAAMLNRPCPFCHEGTMQESNGVPRMQEPSLSVSIGKDQTTDLYCIQVIGDTYPHREELKAAGYKWNAEYRRWQFDFDGIPTADDAQAALNRLQPLADHFGETALTVTPR